MTAREIDTGPELLWTRPRGQATAALLLAHGAGAPMDSEFMEAFAEAAARCGLAVARFEFAYMAGRRIDGRKRPPPRAEKLIDDYADALQAARADWTGKLAIGGKSLGGRVATMLAAGPVADSIAGVICLGYPLHPAGKPEALRLSPILEARCPILICQGIRDPMGSREEFDRLDLPPSVTAHWLPDGDHSFKPRKTSGATVEDNIASAAEAAARFLF